MKLHFYAIVNAIEFLLPQFRKQGGAQIVNITSVGAMIPVPHLSSYCASKFALAGYSEVLAGELYKDKIYVTTVYPGLMRTGSAIQADFKGGYQTEFAFFAITDTLVSVSAPTATKQILQAVKEKRTQLIISLHAKLGHLAFSLFPELFNNLMRAVITILPDSESTKAHTGAGGDAWIESQKWAKPILSVDKKARKQLNQRKGIPTKKSNSIKE